MIQTVEELLLAIINAVGVDNILKLCSQCTSQESAQAILAAEYAAAEATAKAAEKAKFGA